jgi:cell division protein FtsX
VPFGSDQAWRTVVGVSRDTIRADLHDLPEAEMFFPLDQSPEYLTNPAAHYSAMTMVVRTQSDPAALVPLFRAAVREAAPDVPVSSVSLMQDAVDRGADGARFTMALLGTFASVALLLVAVGIFGVMSHDVSGRRREIGIRLALGASRGRVVGRIIRDGVVAAAVGLAIGLAASFAMRGGIEGLLFGVRPLDPSTFAIVTGALALIVTLACVLPAWRVSRMNVGRELK